MNSNDNTYTVVVVGAGQIGSGFDGPDSKFVLTHAHAASKHSHTRLAALVDIDEVRGKEEARRWDCAYYPSLAAMREEMQPDIIVIAAPDHAHFDLLTEAIALRPKVIICEKPICVKGQEAALRALVRDADIPIVVNYNRRFDPTVLQLREDIGSGVYGKVLCATGLYVKGVVHNGTHVLDLARYLFGEVLSARPTVTVPDYPGESSVGAAVTLERCPQFYLMAGDGREFFVLEFDIITERGRLRFTTEGFYLSEQGLVPDPMFPGYTILGPEKRQETGLFEAMQNLMGHAVAVAEGREEPRVTVEDALKTHEVCVQLAAGETL